MSGTLIGGDLAPGATFLSLNVLFFTLFATAGKAINLIPVLYHCHPVKPVDCREDNIHEITKQVLYWGALVRARDRLVLGLIGETAAYSAVFAARPVKGVVDKEPAGRCARLDSPVNTAIEQSVWRQCASILCHQLVSPRLVISVPPISVQRVFCLCTGYFAPVPSHPGERCPQSAMLKMCLYNNVHMD